MSGINIVLENRDDIHVAVEEKDINVEVPAGKDGRSLHPRGEWSASVTYAYLDLVGYEGSSYVALKAVPAGTLPTDTTYWMLSAEKGEPGTPEWGNISGDLSDQTDLADALDAKADVIISSASGSIASFADGSASPVTALSVGIEPVQDLHGYDNPWPAGGGVNIMPAPVAYDKTTNGIHIVSDGNGKITISGTSTSSVTVNINLSKTFVLPETSYLHCNNNAVSTDMNFILYANGEQVKNVSLPTKNYITAAIGHEGEISSKVQIYMSSNKTVNLTLYPSVEITNEVTSWTPYSNICPISGHTEANIYHEAEYDPNANPTVTIDLDGTRYGGTLNVLTAEMTVDRAIVDLGTLDWTITTTGTYSRFMSADLVGIIVPPATSNIVTTAICSNYKAVAFAFVYTATIDKVFAITDNGSNARGRVNVVDGSYSDADTFKTAMSGVQLCYPLVTPLTVQLTPSQLSTLLGQNHLWSDTGDTSVTYRADTKLYIDSKIAQTAKVTRQMIADSATADGKAPKSLATGDLIIVGDELRKATTNIGNGSAITASNSTKATLADVIKALQ